MAARIDVTHVGSLPRGDELTALLLAKDHGKPYDAAEFDKVVQAAIDDAVKKQVAAGVTIVSDGELGKVGYSTYVTERLDRVRRACRSQARARSRGASGARQEARRDHGPPGVRARRLHRPGAAEDARAGPRRHPPLPLGARPAWERRARHS